MNDNSKSLKLCSISEIPGVNWTSEALKNEDVLQLIFDNFDLQPGSKTVAQTRKDLLAAAKTCKAFVEPALNSLWRVLPSMLPLLLLLPSAEVSNNCYFANKIDNWERFEVHARRVRTLYMETSRIIIPSTIYLRICALRGIHLLPGLNEIYIPDNTSIDLSPIMLLVSGASLNVVELNNNAISDRSFFIPFLDSLASKSPHLRHLSLCGAGNVSLEFVSRFANLRRLEIRILGTYLYPQTLRRLGTLANLLDLTLQVDVGPPIPLPAINVRSSTLSSSSYYGRLQRLHVIGIPSSITRVLDDVNLTSLTKLVIDESDNTRETETFWKRLFNQISVCYAMEDIEVNQYTRTSGHERCSLLTSWFFPLLNLKNVKNLVINGSVLSGSDDDFRLLACAFPKLQKFIVPHGYYSQGRTLACLFYFSQECPDLLEIKISLAFDISSNIEAIERLPHTILVNNRHPLEKLYINSQFGKTLQPTKMVQVAQYLNLIFPNITILEAYNSTATDIQNWTGIQQTRVALRSTWLDSFQRTRSDMMDRATYD